MLNPPVQDKKTRLDLVELQLEVERLANVLATREAELAPLRQQLATARRRLSAAKANELSSLVRANQAAERAAKIIHEAERLDRHKYGEKAAETVAAKCGVSVSTVMKVLAEYDKKQGRQQLGWE